MTCKEIPAEWSPGNAQNIRGTQSSNEFAANSFPLPMNRSHSARSWTAAALCRFQTSQSGGGPPHSKTLPRGTSIQRGPSCNTHSVTNKLGASCSAAGSEAPRRSCAFKRPPNTVLAGAPECLYHHCSSRDQSSLESFARQAAALLCPTPAQT